jgi:hypothetical protein
MLDGLSRGDAVTIHDPDGRLLAVGRVASASTNMVTIMDGHGGNLYMRSTGRVRHSDRIEGGKLFARPATPEQVEEATAELDRREADRLERLAADRRAAFDALPEPVRLARQLRYATDWIDEDDFGTAPLDALRAVVAWAESRRRTAGDNE